MKMLGVSAHYFHMMRSTIMIFKTSFLRIQQLCEECKNMYPQFNTTMNIRVEVKSADGSPTLPEQFKNYLTSNKTK